MEKFPHANDNEPRFTERSLDAVLNLAKLESMRRVVHEALRAQADLATEEDVRAAEGAYEKFTLAEVVAMINASNEALWRGSPLLYRVLAERIEEYRRTVD
ncbi:MAG TPA: hypothetical protein VNU25_03265 [Candidatus Paceibacterota bacterium]|nr:hypothetical protein [Candidatus Paceibacterota bacterium]